MSHYSMKLEWKPFNVCLTKMDIWLKANIGAIYCGNSADTALNLWFTEEPASNFKEAILAKWNNLDENSEEVAAYKSASDLAELKAQKVASAKSKLLALGLSEEEVAAIIG